MFEPKFCLQVMWLYIHVSINFVLIGLSAAISSSIASLSNSLPNSTDASPRKKPRKQLL